MNLLRRIEKYLTSTGIPKTRFGRETAVVGDPRLVDDLWRGRQLRQSTLDRITAHLDSAGA